MYRSAIFYHDSEQKELAQKIIKEIDESEKYETKVVTQVAKLDVFYPAEDYHQNYFNLNPLNSYCQRIVDPKIQKFVNTYKELLK